MNTTYDPADLTVEQLAGVACVRCGHELIHMPAVQAGAADGFGAVYACADGCER